MEWGWPSSSLVVMTVTPVAKSPIANLKSSLLTKAYLSCNNVCLRLSPL